MSTASTAMAAKSVSLFIIFPSPVAYAPFRRASAPELFRLGYERVGAMPLLRIRRRFKPNAARACSFSLAISGGKKVDAEPGDAPVHHALARSRGS